MKALTIRVTDEEHKLMQAVAAKRFMTITAVVRSHFHQLNLIDNPPEPKPDPRKQPTTPEVTKKAVPLGINEWRDEVYARRQAGESFADIAASYHGGEVEQIKRLYKRAVDDLQYHKDAGIVYDPASLASDEVRRTVTIPATTKTTTVYTYPDLPTITTTEEAPEDQEDDKPLEVDDFDEYVRGLDSEKDTTLVYAPVDPDNPTEAETAVADAIAQKRLKDMGLL